MSENQLQGNKSVKPLADFRTSRHAKTGSFTATGHRLNSFTGTGLCAETRQTRHRKNTHCKDSERCCRATQCQVHQDGLGNMPIFQLCVHRVCILVTRLRRHLRKRSHMSLPPLPPSGSRCSLAACTPGPSQRPPCLLSTRLQPGSTRPTMGLLRKVTRGEAPSCAEPSVPVHSSPRQEGGVLHRLPLLHPQSLGNARRWSWHGEFGSEQPDESQNPKSWARTRREKARDERAKGVSSTPALQLALRPSPPLIAASAE